MKRKSKQNMKSMKKTATAPRKFDKPQDSFYNKEELCPAGRLIGTNERNGCKKQRRMEFKNELDKQAGTEVREVCHSQSDVLYHDPVRGWICNSEGQSPVLLSVSVAGRQPDHERADLADRNLFNLSA